MTPDVCDETNNKSNTPHDCQEPPPLNTGNATNRHYRMNKVTLNEPHLPLNEPHLPLNEPHLPLNEPYAASNELCKSTQRAASRNNANVSVDRQD